MNLKINATNAVTETVMCPGDTLFFLRVTITGSYQERMAIHGIIVEELQNNNLLVTDSITLGRDWLSVIDILKCTSPMFIELVRKNTTLLIKEVELGLAN